MVRAAGASCRTLSDITLENEARAKPNAKASFSRPKKPKGHRTSVH